MMTEVGCVAGEGKVTSQDLCDWERLLSDGLCIRAGKNSRVSQSKVTVD